MTDLLSPATRRTSPPSNGPTAGRSPVVAGVVAGVLGAGVSLLSVVAVALGGWFAADAGRYGDTRDAVRVGADAWLLAHGAGLRLDGATVGVVPLGLTLWVVWIVHRAARRAGRRSGLGAAAQDLRAVLAGAGVQVVVHALVALLVAVAASHRGAESDLLRALVGGALLGLVGATAGWLSGSGQLRALLGGAPRWVSPVLRGAAGAVLLVLAGASLLVAAALVLDFGTAATVLSRLHADGPGGFMYTLVGVAFVPNALLLGSAYLLGPGFAMGAGTVVSPSVVVLGPIPSFPLLAALPGDGPTPVWAPWLVGVPVLLTLAAVWLAVRTAPVGRVDLGALWGLAAGLLAAVGLTVLVTLAGGSAGPGRMSEVGTPALSTFLAAAVACGGGGLVGGALGAWSARRRSRRAASTPGTSAR